MKNTSTIIPKLIYGTAWKKERTSDLVAKAIQLGFRGIDTACQPKHYHEPGVGEALTRLNEEGIKREDLYIQTKFTPVDGQDPRNIPYNRLAPLNEQVLESFRASQTNLGVDYVDGLILHSPLHTFEETMTVWKSMEIIHNEGKAKRIGISNCYDLDMLKQIYNEALVKPGIVQNRFYQTTDYDKAIRVWCLDNEIAYQSFWTLTANPHLLSSTAVRKAAHHYKKTPAQILFRALVQLGITPLTGTSSEQHMKEDLEILGFSLPDDVVQEINSLF